MLVAENVLWELCFSVCMQGDWLHALDLHAVHF